MPLSVSKLEICTEMEMARIPQICRNDDAVEMEFVSAGNLCAFGKRFTDRLLLI